MAELPPRFAAGLAKAVKAHGCGVPLPAVYEALSASQRIVAREQYVKDQAGLCAHCKESLDGEPPLEIRSLPINWMAFPGNRSFLKHPVHLHHSHETGLTLGAVHALCNAVLWQYHGE